LKKYILLILLFSLAIFGCKSIPEMSEEKATNITENGFLDNHHFQVIIKSKPDENNNGLVAKRESAITSARNIYQQAILNTMMEYVVNLENSNKLIHSEIYNKSNELKNALFPYFKYGNDIAEYFDKFNNAYIIYRIQKKNLKAEFNQLHKKYRTEWSKK
jgi:hypothetical protein